MKKKVLIFLLVFLLAFPFFHTAGASSQNARLVDHANLLTSSEETELLSVLNEISERQRLDIVIVTVDSLDGKSPRAYADDYYDDHDYGFGSGKDGVLLLIAMSTRDWYISTSGYGIRAFTDAGIDYIGNYITPDLGDGEYAAAFRDYAKLCDDFISQARNGSPYDEGNMPRGKYNVMQYLLISLGITTRPSSSMRRTMPVARTKMLPPSSF